MTAERWARIKSVFSDALERDGDERRAFLDQACGEDAELRREVESLFQEREGVTELRPPVRQTDWTGRTVSHFRILEKLGEGGMGIVYRAEDTKLHRTVALKFLRPDAVGSDELKTRFLQEARAAAALDHP
ncbi:MAG: hypothetical protein GY953_51370, partial [bacterium]|nr:hypothetical protein [bacterium]